MVQRIDVSLDELRQLRCRIGKQQLKSGDWLVVGALVSKRISQAEAQQDRMLKKLVGDNEQDKSSSDSSNEVESAWQCGESNGNDDGSSGQEALGGSEMDPADDATTAPVSEANDSSQKPAPKDKPKGHGRNGAGAYVNATHSNHVLEPGVIGALCEDCESDNISKYREKIVVHIKGQPLFGAEIHHYEQGRCRKCHRIIRASGPDHVLEGLGSNYITYGWSACGMLIVMHYFAGAPFKRLESLHSGWGVPMPDSNQWSIVDGAADLLLPLYKALERHGIQTALTLRIDDTGSMVISVRKQIQAEILALQSLGESTRNVRTGINATGVYLETPNGVVILFYTGRHHAGEMIDRLLKHRKNSEPKLVKVTDAASKNFAHEHQDKLVEATCNAHALLKFRDIKDKYPDEYAVAGEVYKKVFDNDDEAKARGMTPDERMMYHRENSKPLMEKLKAFCEDKIKSKLVEPRSLLWEPVTFIINQWSRLTRFYETPGVPLDTNIVEQALIIPVRYLAGSFNFKNETGAEVGDQHMSLIASARANDVEPAAYLADCLRNHEDLAKRPEYYLPWVYRERIRERDKTPGNDPESRVGASNDSS